MTCDACGREVPSDARFCPHCGTAVAAQAGAPAPVTDAEAPADPADTGEPAEATEATDPADAEAPADPTDAEAPADPADTGEPAEPTEATEANADPDADASSRSKTSVRTVLGNLLAVAAGGTLGVLAGMAIRQVM